jgi:Secretion system C-terminal sorting domain
MNLTIFNSFYFLTSKPLFMKKHVILFLSAMFLSIASFAIGPIIGTPHVCVGSTTVLSDSTSGGLWFSSNTAIATIGSTGVVTGISSGVVTISYYYAGLATMSFTVNPVAAITGDHSVCVGSSITLTATPPGGTWLSSNPAVATVVGGVVTGVGSGVVNIYYSAGGCNAYHVVSVNAAAAITGDHSVCVGSSIALTATPPGGTWLTSNPAVATVVGGVVTGVGAGVVNIYYSAGGCNAYHIVTVNAAAAIAGDHAVCVGSSITLTATPPGGTWLTSNPAVATVSGGVLTAVGAGVVNIYYSAGGCNAYHAVSVNAAAAITGDHSLCVGSSTTLTATPPGGTWLTSNPAVATVAGGVVTGITGGVVNIYYSAGGCNAYHVVTVNTTAAISGDHSVCTGSAITLTATPAGGSWLSSNTAVATVSAGVVTGVSAGVVNIYYHVGGCYAYHSVTVNAAAAITGGSAVCVGSAITLTATPPGGSWLSSNTAVAIVSGGVVTGVSSDVVNIYYSAGGCYAYHHVTVNSAAAITGDHSVCVGSSITLTGTPPGGSWISSSTAIATVTGGVVTGVSGGVVNIYYSSGGCYAYHTVTVNTTATITGSSVVHVGAAITLSATPSGGSWLSSNTTVAPVSSGGVVSGVSVGVVNIYYVSGGCYAYSHITVYPELLPLGDPGAGYMGYETPHVGLGLAVAHSDDGDTDPVATDNDEMLKKPVAAKSKNSTGIQLQGVDHGLVKTFPNPASTTLNIRWADLLPGNADVVISDVAGRTVYNTVINVGDATGQAQLKLPEVKDGIYLFTIKSDTIYYSSRLVIKK